MRRETYVITQPTVKLYFLHYQSAPRLVGTLCKLHSAYVFTKRTSCLWFQPTNIMDELRHGGAKTWTRHTLLSHVDSGHTNSTAESERERERVSAHSGWTATHHSTASWRISTIHWKSSWRPGRTYFPPRVPRQAARAHTPARPRATSFDRRALGHALRAPVVKIQLLGFQENVYTSVSSYLNTILVHSPHQRIWQLELTRTSETKPQQRSDKAAAMVSSTRSLLVWRTVMLGSICVKLSQGQIVVCIYLFMLRHDSEAQPYCSPLMAHCITGQLFLLFLHLLHPHIISSGCHPCPHKCYIVFVVSTVNPMDTYSWGFAIV